MKLPYGYVLVGEEVAIHEENANVVRSIFEYYLAGASLEKIVDMLAKGISSPTGNFKWTRAAESRHNEGCQKVRCTVRDKENAYYPAGAPAPRPGAFYQQGTGRWAVSFGSISKPTQADRRGSVQVSYKPGQVGAPSERHTNGALLYPPAGVYSCALLRGCCPDR